jgi:hypothetical protein
MMVVGLLLSGHNPASGAKLELRLPAFAGDSVWITAFRGSRQDTVVAARIDNNGNATLKLPAPRGICFLQTADDNAFPFVCTDREDLFIICPSRNLFASNVSFRLSPENDSLIKWIAQFAAITERTALWQHALRMYPEDKPQYRFIEHEIATLDAEKSQLKRHITVSPLYAARYVEIRHFIDENALPLYDYMQDKTACEKFRRFLLDSLNIETLYTSDIWKTTLQTASELYRQKNDERTDGIFRDQFIDDMQTVIKRIASEEIKAQFLADMYGFCLQNSSLAQK